MDCQYLVNGEWVSKSQLKQILNNGVLDNLIAENKIQLEGFIVDETKLQRQTTTVSENFISAKELQKILIEEISSREGYPLNMIEALELNEDGTDFKIPIWSSNYVDKFEALLTSMVSNKIIKHKMKGTSSVLGSEEGFKIREDLSTEETDKLIQDLGIVTTSEFDPKVG
jgi:hypothetical protein